MSGTLILLLMVGIGGLVGLVLGLPRGRPGVGLFLGAFLSVLGWVMILEGQPRTLDTPHTG
jgi:hypothetical protein